MLKRLTFILTVSFLGCLTAQTGQIETRLDYLAWKPFGSSINWAILSEPPIGLTTSHDTLFVLSPGYRSGVRAEITFRSCSCPLRALARYFWVEHKESVRLTNPDAGNIPGVGNASGISVIGNRGGTISGTNEIGAVGRARLKQPFHAADILLGYDLCPQACFQATLVGGGTFLYMDRSLQAFLLAFDPTFSNPFQPYSTRTRFVGGGPSFGIQGQTPLWRLCITGEVTIASLIGKRLNRSQGQLTSSIPFNRLVNPTMTGAALGLFAQVGVSYRQEWCGRCVGVQLGWEQRTYQNVSSIHQASGIFSVGTLVTTTDVDILFVNMGGPYAGLSVEF